MSSVRLCLRQAVGLICLLSLFGCGIPVSRYTTSTIADGDADTIFTGARNTLSTNDGAGDVSCTVSNLSRNGNVTAFMNGNGIVNSQADFNTIVGLNGYVKVVNQINWCGTIAPNWIGCSPTPGTSMLVVRFTNNQEGILWAHEYGHTKGLPHRTDSDAVMNPTIATTHTKVTQTECDSFRQ